MGLRAAFFTAVSSIGSFARKLGFSVFEIDDVIKKNTPAVEYSIASELLTLLGFSGGKVLENNDFDLVFLHIRAGQELRALKDKITINAGVDWLDKFVGELMGIAQPASDIAARLHFSLVLSYGNVSENEGQKSSISILPIEENSDLSLLRPCQSYSMKGGKQLDDIRYGNVYWPFLSIRAVGFVGHTS
uniref:mRNA export factor elf1 n=1 Tax=Anthurium amnicola TaxID=1678845 RepID=A0A1D1XG92_9ARAE